MSPQDDAQHAPATPRVSEERPNGRQEVSSGARPKDGQAGIADEAGSESERVSSKPPPEPMKQPPRSAGAARAPRPSAGDESDSSPPAYGAGSVLDGKYRLMAELSEGGMGSLYVAHNEALDVDVVVKLIRTDLRGVEQELLADRLLQEARAAARLGHPAIARVFDFGKTPDGDPYLVMERLEGEDLATALDNRGTIQAIRAVQTLLPVIHALQAAHEKGIVHRDIKPDNIYLATGATGIQPKLIDFGIAKLERQPSERLTAIGTIVGTPGYMAPEQARGDEAHQPADIWAICVVLYEMITGDLPFEGDNYNALLRAIIEEEPTPLSSDGNTDDELSTIIFKGLAKESDARWESMDDLGVELATWLLGLGVEEDICGASLGSLWLGDRTSQLPEQLFESFAPPPPSGQPHLSWAATSDGPPTSSQPPPSGPPASWPGRQNLPGLTPASQPPIGSRPPSSPAHTPGTPAPGPSPTTPVVPSAPPHLTPVSGQGPGSSGQWVYVPTPIPPASTPPEGSVVPTPVPPGIVPPDGSGQYAAVAPGVIPPDGSGQFAPLNIPTPVPMPAPTPSSREPKSSVGLILVAAAILIVGGGGVLVWAMQTHSPADAATTVVDVAPTAAPTAAPQETAPTAATATATATESIAATDAGGAATATATAAPAANQTYRPPATPPPGNAATATEPQDPELKVPDFL